MNDSDNERCANGRPVHGITWRSVRLEAQQLRYDSLIRHRIVERPRQSLVAQRGGEPREGGFDCGRCHVPGRGGAEVVRSAGGRTNRSESVAQRIPDPVYDDMRESIVRERFEPTSRIPPGPGEPGCQEGAEGGRGNDPRPVDIGWAFGRCRRVGSRGGAGP